MALIQRQDPQVPIATQADLLSLNRTSLYYKPREVSALTLLLRRRIDEIHTFLPSAGSRGIRDILRLEGIRVNRKAIQHHMQDMAISVIYPGPNLSKRNHRHRVYPYLLRNLDIVRNNQVWQTDVTYIRLRNGWVYLTALIDVQSRMIVDWELSTTMDSGFILTMLTRAFARVKPEILNSDQGSQYTSDKYIELVKETNVAISMDGRGRATDNAYIERFWRTLKQQEVYLHEYSSPKEARSRIAAFIECYNYFRPHQGLNGKTPGQVYQGVLPLRMEVVMKNFEELQLADRKKVS